MKRKYLIFIALSLVAVAAMAQDATASAHAGSWSYDLYMWFKSHMNYGTILLLMAIESSIIPLPSEVVVPPAAYFSLQADSPLNFGWVIAAATLGAFIGSAINYGLSVLLGRPIIYAFAESRLGHFLRLSAKKLDHAEEFFRKRGAVSIFIGRLLPVVRHLISIPAGLARMHLPTFCLYTILGAGLWNLVLAALGYLLYLVVPDDRLLFDQLEHYSLYIKIAGFALLAAVAAYLIYKYKIKKSTDKP